MNNKQTEIEDSSSYTVSEMIYVPEADLCFAKEKSCRGLDWYQSHEELQKKGLRMPTIPEFMKYFKFLRSSDDPEHKKMYVRMFGDWLHGGSYLLDANFKYMNKGGKEVDVSNSDGCWYINSDHRFDSELNLLPRKSEKLEDCLGDSRCADIMNHNKQGLPIREFGYKCHFYAPEHNNSVAAFSSSGGPVSLNCDFDPNESEDVGFQGVFACAERSRRYLAPFPKV